MCICGGGSLGHVIAGFLSARHGLAVNILTSKPELWQHELAIHTPENEVLHAQLAAISAEPQAVIPNADIVLLCVPGFLMRETLHNIKPFLKPTAFVGAVFSSTGFFFEAMNILDDMQPLWGFQRVPFIARTKEYGKSANLLGYKNGHNIAVEHATEAEKERFRQTIETLFEAPTHLLQNYLEASLSNSNPLIHTARLYSLFHDWHEGKVYPEQIPFYAAWTSDAAELLIKMDSELFELLNVLPVSPNFLLPILDYYESHDAQSLAQKIASIPSLKPILTPMINVDGGWLPDFGSRYFTEDFPYGLRFIYELIKKHGISTPTIEKVYAWGASSVKS